ncbi:unnamed protein product [Rangifer tarandus platyrhynchus]|uniref:Uncharacterized protein n=1 Tax=Rangifer tarandus platyrhynchus TaxID=3082113 RepID=A0AC59ZMK1_RANTA
MPSHPSSLVPVPQLLAPPTLNTANAEPPSPLWPRGQGLSGSSPGQCSVSRLLLEAGKPYIRSPYMLPVSAPRIRSLPFSFLNMTQWPVPPSALSDAQSTIRRTVNHFASLQTHLLRSVLKGLPRLAPHREVGRSSQVTKIKQKKVGGGERDHDSEDSEHLEPEEILIQLRRKSSTSSHFNCGRCKLPSGQNTSLACVCGFRGESEGSGIHPPPSAAPPAPRPFITQ